MIEYVRTPIIFVLLGVIAALVSRAPREPDRDPYATIHRDITLSVDRCALIDCTWVREGAIPMTRSFAPWSRSTGTITFWDQSSSITTLGSLSGITGGGTITSDGTITTH